jgi:hypothetical protein
MSDLQSQDPDIRAARHAYDEIRLAHEAATTELTACRERLRAAEARRTSDPDGYCEALTAARVQRDRVLELVHQAKQAAAILTLAENPRPIPFANRTLPEMFRPEV